MPIRYELDDLRRRVVVTVEGLFQTADIFAIMARQPTTSDEHWEYGTTLRKLGHDDWRDLPFS